ncbi:LytTR family DNA-binding domain-containing protein [Telluribacter sp.]|jgi:DNA-binding LytR/AlgR family response regulator|uniref:LytR/AlgR family response regulator transcription factor n=1 Tax=Telluribacter sp. TaxID=1978767 RepID=UPI002E106B53|nr:LytTR family DNA-binding domain-containing protein [Telluribacter sp.]
MESYSSYSVKQATRATAASYSPTLQGTDIAIYIMGQIQWLSPDEITCLEGEGNYTYVYTCRGKRFLVSRTLKSLTEHLNDTFLRVHKSYIVNTGYIVDRIDDDRVIRLVCGKEVVVARRKIKEIAELLNLYQGRISA